QVVDIVFRNLRRGHDERLHIAQILLVFGRQQDIAERYDRRIGDFLHALAFRREDDIFLQLPLPTGRVPAAVQFFELHALAIGVVVARLGELGLLGGKFLDDFIRVDVVVRRPHGQTHRRYRGRENDSTHFGPHYYDDII